MKPILKLKCIIMFAVVIFSNHSLSQESEIELKKIAADTIDSYFPEFVEISYTESKEGSDESWLIKYDYDSSRSWELNPTLKGDIYSFGSGGAAFFAKGAYTFSDEGNPNDYSKIGGQYKKRWLNVNVISRQLTAEENQQVDECMRNSPDFSVTVNQCRRQLGFGATEFSMLYFDVDAHFNIEGNKDFDERNYVYGVGIKFSAMPKKTSWVHALNILEYPGRLLRQSGEPYTMLPIFSLGVEQVDPKEDTRRSGLVDNAERYDRFYAEIRHTSPLGMIKDSPVKLSLNYQYFEEIDAPEAIKSAGYDVNQFYTVAFQVPSKILPFFATSESEFIVSYSEGELPFGRTDEKIFEIGWKTNVEFGKILSP